MSADVRLAVLGDPLRFTLSPVLHRAGCEAAGVLGESRALRTPVGELAATLERLAAEGYVGCNLTMPLKEHALALVRSPSDAAVRARSVNTVTFHATGTEGETTDGPGFLDLLVALGRDPVLSDVVFLGAGGATRSLAVALAAAGAPPVRVVSRRAPVAEPAWGGPLGARWSAWGSSAARAAAVDADVLVNGTPLGAGDLVHALDGLPRATLVVDLTYGESVTPWVRDARARGHEAVDGLGLLVHQARRSLSHWLRREVPLEPLAAAVGWPR